jgi:hypothetical protein
MKTSYAVKWREPDGRTFLGRLEFAPKALILEGRNGSAGSIRRTIDFDELRSFRIGRQEGDRLNGQLTVVVERPGGDFLIASTVIHAGVLQELVQRLAELRLSSPRRATVIVPLKEGVLERARQLADKGPPFDPVETLLTRHQLLLTPAEAIFVFEAESETALEALLGQIDLWAAAAAWRDIVDGPPRLAELVYAWERPLQLSGVGLGL